MRQVSLWVLLAVILGLTACTEGPAVAPPNLRQQTATTLAELALTPKPTRVVQPTNTVFVPPTASPKPDLAPITVTPVFGVSPTPTEVVEEEPTAVPTIQPTATPTPDPVTSDVGQIFFLRNGSIWRYSVADNEASQFAPRGSLVRVSPNGRQIAVVRNGTLSVIQASGNATKALASDVIEVPVWSPDGDALLIVTGPAVADEFNHACAAGSSLQVLELASGTETTIGPGCQPAWDPQGKRIAYVTEAFGSGSQASNALNLVNRVGENGWTVVSAPVLNANFPDPRRLFYAPFWSEDGKTLYSFGYVGYRALSDISTLEQIDPVNGGTVPIGIAFDVVPGTVRADASGTWVTYTSAGAKGTSTVTALRITDETHVFQYIDGPIEVRAVASDTLEYASQPVWAPDAALIATLYCETNMLFCQADEQASVELLNPRTGKLSTLIEDVDGNSFLEWSR